MKLGADSSEWVSAALPLLADVAAEVLGVTPGYRAQAWGLLLVVVPSVPRGAVH